MATKYVAYKKIFLIELLMDYSHSINTDDLSD